MSFDELFPAPRGPRLRAAILRALNTAYAENAGRFAPEDLGDNNTTFGVNVVHNGRHLVELEVDGIDGVVVRRAKNSFWLEIDGRPLYIYKAPPGQSTVHGMRFDESDLRLQILEQNTEQLQFDFTTPVKANADADADATTVTTPILHPVITHFGSPEAGFGHAMIGAPYKTADGGCEWSWIEPFDQADDPGLAADAAGDDRPEPPADDFEDLRIRDKEQDRQGQTGEDGA
jgi:hypothetical protein